MTVALQQESINGGIKKISCFSFSLEKLRKWGGGVSPNPRFPYQKKLSFFFIFFKRGVWSNLFQKGVIIKKWGFWAIFAKKGGHIDFIQKKLRIFRIFSPKRGGVWPIPKFPYQKKLGHSELLRGGRGGLRISEFF